MAETKAVKKQNDKSVNEQRSRRPVETQNEGDNKKKYQSLEQAGSRDVTWRLKIKHFLLRLAPFIFISFKKQKANGQVKQAASSFPTTAHLHNATEKIHSPQVSGRRTPPKKRFKRTAIVANKKKQNKIRWFEYMQMRRVTFSDSDVHYTTHDVQHGTEATDGASSRQSAGSTGPPHAICRQFRRSAVSTLFSRPKSKKWNFPQQSICSVVWQGRKSSSRVPVSLRRFEAF